MVEILHISFEYRIKFISEEWFFEGIPFPVMVRTTVLRDEEIGNICGVLELNEANLVFCK